MKAIKMQTVFVSCLVALALFVSMGSAGPVELEALDHVYDVPIPVELQNFLSQVKSIIPNVPFDQYQSVDDQQVLEQLGKSFPAEACEKFVSAFLDKAQEHPWMVYAEEVIANVGPPSQACLSFAPR